MWRQVTVGARRLRLGALLAVTCVCSCAALYPDPESQPPPHGKKFGGYRIVPKTCADLTSTGKAAKGVCMFNYECAQRDGQVVGSCMDGFLFGACCRLPPSPHPYPHPHPLPHTQPQPNPSPTTSSLRPELSTARPITIHPVGETVLLHRNGSVVIDRNDPDEFDRLKQPLEGSAVANTHANNLTNAFYEQSGSLSLSKTTQADLDSVTPSGQGTTRHDEENFPVTIAHGHATKPPTYVYYTKPSSVTKPVSYTSSNQPLKPKPAYGQSQQSQSTTEKSYTTGSYYEDNMLLIPTINHHGVGVGVEDATNSASINHILHLLDETEPSPVPTHSPSPSLSTWGSVDGKPDKTDSSTTQHYRPTATVATTAVHHVQGPSFQVTPQKQKPKPPDGSTPEPPPTVIVLGPFNTYSSLKPPSHDQTVTVLSPFQHSTVVTVRPGGSVISVKPPPYTHTHTHTHAQPSASPWTSPTPFPWSGPPSSSPLPSSSPQASVTRPVQFVVTEPAKPYPSVYSSTKPIAFTTVRPAPTPGHTSHRPVIVTQTSPGYVIRPNPYPQKNSTLVSIYQSDPLTSRPQQQVNGNYKPVEVLRPVLDEELSLASNDSSNLLVAFPPVRDPNITLLGAQTEKPDTLTSSTAVDEEYTTLHILENDAMKNKIHDWVGSLVQSMASNYYDLEKVLIDGETSSNSTHSQKPTKRPQVPTKPVSTKPVSTKPVPTKPSRPTKKPVTKPTVSITKPTDRPDVTIYTNRPTTSVLLSTFSKPEDLVTKKPTKKPIPSSTVVILQASPSPSPTTTTTKRPAPTTVVLDDISISQEETPKPPEVNYRKECGVRPLMKNGRIVGGKGATFGEWPWQVLVREATWLGLFTKNKCGGVLITKSYVITAAHCQPGFLASLVAVFGEYDISGELEKQQSVSKNVRRVIVHRQYDAATFENDIALLELESPVLFDSHIVPICMPNDADDFTGRMATVTGWGRLKYGGGVPSVLQEVQVPIIENSVCQEMFHTAGHSKSIIGSFLCAGYANGQRDSCEGDSGGPLMIERGDGRWVLAGTVSHGIKCAAPYLPGVYMRTTFYKPWLQTITGVRSSRSHLISS